LDDTFHAFRKGLVRFISIVARCVLIIRRYVILQPVCQIFFKSPEMAMKSVLLALLLPTPSKDPVQPTKIPDAMPEELLNLGAFYRGCAAEEVFGFDNASFSGTDSCKMTDLRPLRPPVSITVDN
jgi:hypothetical protein